MYKTYDIGEGVLRLPLEFCGPRQPCFLGCEYRYMTLGMYYEIREDNLYYDTSDIIIIARAEIYTLGRMARCTSRQSTRSLEIAYDSAESWPAPGYGVRGTKKSWGGDLQNSARERGNSEGLRARCRSSSPAASRGTPRRLWAHMPRYYAR